MRSRFSLLMVFLCPLAAAAQQAPVPPPPAALRLDIQQRFQLPGRISGLAFAPDGKALAAGDTRGILGLWSPATGQALGRHELAAGIGGVAFAPDGKTLAFGGGDGVVRLWDVAASKEILTLRGHDEDVRAVAFSPDGTVLASVSTDQMVRLWDPVAGKPLRQFDGHTSWIHAVAFAPDGKTLLSGSRDQTARLWDPASGKERQRFHIEDDQVWSVAFAPDGRSVIVGSSDHLVRVWDPQTGKLVRTLEGHSARIWALACSADGRVIASGSEDKTVCLWEAVSGRLIGSLAHHTSCVTALAFSPAGRVLAAGSEGGLVLTWDLTFRDKAGQPVTDEELQGIWTALGGEDVRRVFRDMARMAGAPKQTVALLREQLRPVPVLEAEKVDRLIADLDSERFAVRQKAAQELELHGVAAAPARRRALGAKPSLEMSRRLQDLLKPLETRLPPPRQLRVLRAIQVLEDIGTAEAQQLLEVLSKGAADAQATQEAKAAVTRLLRR